MRTLAAAVAVTLALSGCARGDGRVMRPPPPGATAPTTTAADEVEPPPESTAFSLTSPAFANGGELPVAQTCDGAGDPPPLQWNDPLAGVVEFVLTVVDLDESNTVQWVVGPLAPDARALTPGSLPAATIDFGYQAPCPQPGDPAHLYAFTLYGLSAPIGLTPTMTPSEAVSIIQSSPAQAAQLTAFYGR